ncbi:MAG: F0F1 ATP synthase subunit B [Chloroflexi bacterium]|nr:F0F1 ATP synthase subunit B [Chloroflexota bacterium]
MDALGINLPGLLTQLVSFLILFFVLSKLLYGPIQKILNERTERIRESLEAAERASEQAASAAERVEQEIAAARVQGQTLIADAREAAGKYREEQEERARGEADAFIVRAKAEIEHERDAAVEQVRQEFASLAMSAAEQIVGKSLDEDTHRQLIERTLEEGLESRKN